VCAAEKTAPPNLKMTQIGPYQLGAKLGSGGMADVYAAVDTRDNAEHPLVALKVAKSDLLAQGGVFRELFHAECKIALRLNHPNLVRAYSMSEVNDPSTAPYLSMEILLGRTLADIFDRMQVEGARIPWELALYLTCSVAEGMHAFHEAVDERGASLELVHRDLNPSNILLTIDGEVKVIDFGLARSREAAATMTSGVVKGKVTYLAPEQLTKRQGDRRVDIFQLGITLWELRMGRRLFLRDQVADTIAAIRAGTVPDPRIGHRDDDVVAPAILRALAQNPDRRYTTMRGFARALAGLDPFPSVKRAAELSEQTYNLAFPGERDRLRAWREHIIKSSG
jgi:eukaryotic-like serine/threonine-protein kinase